MCQSPLHGFLTALPKVEQHMHLEGSLSPELLFALAEKNGVELPSPDADPAFASPAALHARYAAFTSLDDFLAYYYIGFRVLRTAADFEALAWAYFERAAATANLRHAEVFFDPQEHAAHGVAPAAVAAGFHAARRRAEAELGVSALLVPCLLRHLPVADGEAMFAALHAGGHFADGTFAGLGLCSSEVGWEPARWAGVFDAARGAGIRRTAHAGEEGPAGFVAAALDDLGAMRIDHGRQAADDDELLERLARDKVLLTVCPISNWKLKGVSSVAEVPIRKLLDKGVRFSINSDDPAYFGGYIQENYCAVEEAFGLSIEEWDRIARHAIEGSWCEQERKDTILKEIDSVLEEWKAKVAA